MSDCGIVHGRTGIVATSTSDLSLELYSKITAAKLISPKSLRGAISSVTVPAAIISIDEVGRRWFSRESRRQEPSCSYSMLLAGI